MLLWDIIRDWFVTYIFGGTLSGNGGFVNGGMIGTFLNTTGGRVKTLALQYYTPISAFDPSGAELIAISFADWCSTTATLIVMISVLVSLWFLVRYFFRMFAGLISGR